MPQNIPEDWRRLSEVGEARVRRTFKRENVDIDLAADEQLVSMNQAVIFWTQQVKRELVPQPKLTENQDVQSYQQWI